MTPNKKAWILAFAVMPPRIGKIILSILISSSIFSQNFALADLPPAQDTINAPLGGGPNFLSDQNHWKTGGAIGTTPTNNVDSMVFIAQNQDLGFDSVIGNLGTLNLYGYDNRKIYVTANNALLGIINDVDASMITRVNTADGTLDDLRGNTEDPKIDLDITGAELEITGNQLDRLRNINFNGNNSILKLSKDEDLTLNSIITANNAGEINYLGTAGKTLTIKGRIGDGGNEVALIKATSGGDIKITGGIGDNFITTIDMRGGDRNLILNSDGYSGYKFNLLHDANQGNIVISSEDVNGPISVAGITQGSILSTSNVPLNKLKFRAALGLPGTSLVLLLENQIDIYAAAIETDTPGKGVMVFGGGANIVDAPIGTANFPLTAVAINDNTTVELLQDVFLGQQIIDIPYEVGLTNGAVIKLKGNLTGDVVGLDTIQSSTPNLTINGTIEFINTAPTTLTGNVTSVNSTKVTNNNATVTGNFDCQLLEFSNPAADATITLNGNAVIGSNDIISEGNNRHSVIFGGNYTGNNIGTLNNQMKNITFANNNTKTGFLSGNIYSSTLTTNNSHLRLLQDSSITGNMTGTNTNLDFNNKTLTYSGENTLLGNLIFNTTFDGTNGGNMTLADADTILDFSGANTATLILTASSALPPAGTTYQYKVFNENTGTINKAPITFISNETNRYIRWSYNQNTYLLSSVVVPDVIGDVNNSGGNENQTNLGEALSDPNLTGNAADIQSNLGLLDANQVANALGSLIPDDTSGIALSEASDKAEKATGSRISNLLFSFNIVDQSNDLIGVASGEDSVYKHGVWINGYYGKAKQKPYQLQNGYSTQSYGATIGVDTLITDDFTLGGALSLIRTNVHHNDQIKGNDKGKSDSSILTIYGLQQLSNNYFLQGVGIVGFTKLSNVEQRKANPLQIQYARARYDSKNYGAQLIGGRMFYLNKLLTFSPMIGFRYSTYHDDGYKETGAGTQNLTVDKKSSNSLEGLIAAKFVMRYAYKNIYLEPQLHAMVNYNINSKAANMRIHIDGLNAPIQIKNQESSRAWYALNMGIDANSDNFDHGIFYEIQLDRQYVSHQGLLKFRFNF
jgi:uncharacterized protein YhjY with autotransporter beta-barrel domain